MVKRLQIAEIESFIGYWFRKVSEYIQTAEFNESEKSISGTIIYDPSSAFIQDHTVSGDGLLVVRGTVIIESALVLFSLLCVLHGETGNPRLIEIEKFRFSKKVFAGSDELTIKVTQTKAGRGLVFADVICYVAEHIVARGKLIGASE
ncbi:MAG: hypothetical protein ABH837_01220 [bacterium]